MPLHLWTQAAWSAAGANVEKFCLGPLFVLFCALPIKKGRFVSWTTLAPLYLPVARQTCTGIQAADFSVGFLLGALLCV